jgi:hypothetical protein
LGTDDLYGKHIADQRRNDRICGLRRPYFWILCVVVAVIVIGAAVGGGVGATQGKNSNKSVSRYGYSSNDETKG